MLMHLGATPLFYNTETAQELDWDKSTEHIS